MCRVEPLTAFSTIGERSRAKLPREFDRSCASWIFSRTHWAELFNSEKRNRIGIFLSAREPDFQEQIKQGIEDGVAYAQQHGIEAVIEVVSPDDELLYLQKIDEMIASEVQGIVLRGIESKAFDERLQILKNQEFLFLRIIKMCGRH